MQDRFKKFLWILTAVTFCTGSLKTAPLEASSCNSLSCSNPNGGECPPFFMSPTTMLILGGAALIGAATGALAGYAVKNENCCDKNCKIRRGDRGEQGPKGDKGCPGPPGPQGPQGIQGPPGSSDLSIQSFSSLGNQTAPALTVTIEIGEILGFFGSHTHPVPMLIQILDPEGNTVYIGTNSFNSIVLQNPLSGPYSITAISQAQGVTLTQAEISIIFENSFSQTPVKIAFDEKDFVSPGPVATAEYYFSY